MEGDSESDSETEVRWQKYRTIDDIFELTYQEMQN